MKKVLSLLLAFVFLQVETWALSGGPQYGGDQGAVVGTYAGVLTGRNSALPRVDPNTGVVIPPPIGTNALGVFVIGVPESDAAQGSVALFANGIFYQGGIVGVANPNENTFEGLAQMFHAISSSVGGGGVSFVYDATADGTIKADIERGNSSTGTTLKGEGEFTFSNFVVEDVAGIPTTVFRPVETLKFRVDGFLQSTEFIVPQNTFELLAGGDGGGGGN